MHGIFWGKMPQNSWATIVFEYWHSLLKVAKAALSVCQIPAGQLFAPAWLPLPL